MKLQYCLVVDVVTHVSKRTLRSGGNDEQNKLNKVKIKRVYLGYKFYDSSRLFIPWGSNVPAKSIKKDYLTFLIESREEWISSSGMSCMSV